jgi:hypothetical protein
VCWQVIPCAGLHASRFITATLASHSAYAGLHASRFVRAKQFHTVARLLTGRVLASHPACAGLHASHFITATHHASSQPRITLHHSHASRFITATHLETSGPRLEFKAPTMYAVWTLSIARIYTSFAKRVRPNNTDRTAKLQSLFAPDITIPCRPR